MYCTKLLDIRKEFPTKWQFLNKTFNVQDCKYNIQWSSKLSNNKNKDTH